MEREKTHSQWNSGTLDKKKTHLNIKKKKNENNGTGKQRREFYVFIRPSVEV